MMNRRTVLGSLTAAALATLRPDAHAQSSETQHKVFFEPADFGARGDGVTLDSPAINRAIDACTQAGGGVVYLRPGTYRSGTIVLKSRVTLYLEAGATILGSLEKSDYIDQPGPNPKGDSNTLHLLFARDAQDVTLAGPGRIDGQGSHFWVPSGHDPSTQKDQWAAVTQNAYLKNPEWRPSPMLEFVNCQWLRIEGVRIENAPGWTLRPINCTNVFIQGVSIKNPNVGPNTDGLDITGCENVFVSDCSIDTGDDAICLKTQNPYGDEPLVNRNITITNCTITTCCNGFKFGTATQGGFENITFTNSVIYNDSALYRDRVISGIALEMVDGGWIDGVVISNIRMKRTRTPIFIRLGNRASRFNYKQNGIRNISISHIEASDALLASSITGIPGRLVENISIDNVRISNELPPQPEWATLNVPENEKNYPEARMFGMLPATGFFVRHVRGLQLRHIEVQNPPNESRSTLLLEDAHDITIDDLRTTPITGDRAVIALQDATDVWIRNAALPRDTVSFVHAEGDATQNVVISGCNLRGTKPEPHPQIALHNNF